MNNQVQQQAPAPQVITKSTILYSERRGATYKPNDEIELYIPPSLGLLNTKQSFLRFRLKCGDANSRLKMMPSARAGVASLFRDITITDGTGQFVLETLQSYALLQGTYNFYSQTESLNKLRKLHEGQPSSRVLGQASKQTGGCGNQYVSGTSSDPATAFSTIEVCLPLYMSGLLTPDRDAVYPLVATNGLRVRIQLEDAQSAMVCMTAPVFTAVDSKNVEDNENDDGSSGGGGYAQSTSYECLANAGGGATSVILKSTKDLSAPKTQAGGVRTAKSVLTDADNGTDIAHLFLVGQSIMFDGNAASTKTITSVELLPSGDANNPAVDGVDAPRVKLNWAGGLAVGAGVSCEIVINSATTNEQFMIDNFEFVAGYVVPPNGYLEAIEKRIASGAFSMDVKTYSDYAVNVSANSLNNSLYINARNNRAKSILTIPAQAQQSSFFADQNIPFKGGLKDYQMILYKVLTPDRKLNINRFTLGSFNGEALREQQNALGACDIKVNNIFKNFQHFFIGRRLATEGYSYNCNRPDEGEIRINIDYDDLSVPLLVHNYICHFRRINVRQDGIEIIY